VKGGIYIMDYKTVLQEQIRELQKIQDENVNQKICDVAAKVDAVVKVAEEISRLVAHAASLEAEANGNSEEKQNQIAFGKLLKVENIKFDDDAEKRLATLEEKVTELLEEAQRNSNASFKVIAELMGWKIGKDNTVIVPVKE